MNKVRTRKRGIFTIILVVMFFSVFIPLSLTLVLWRFVYWGTTTRALGLSEIETALNGATQLLTMYSPLTGSIPDTAGFAQLKRLLNGPIVSFRFGPFSADELQLFLRDYLETKNIFVSESIITDSSGREIGQRNADGGWVLSASDWVGKGAFKWDSLPEPERRAYANAEKFMQVSRDISKAVVRLGTTGYLWAISAVTERGQHCYELIHPQLEGIDITNVTNNKNIPVGYEIATLRGKLLNAGSENYLSRSDIVRYDYSWKNPEETRERNKIALLRYIKSHNLVLAAGLYEDEYLKPAQAAEQLFVLITMFMAAIIYLSMFLFIRKLSKSLNTLTRYAELTAMADGTVHRLAPTGFHELDQLSESLSVMENEILKRETNLVHELKEKDVLIQEVHHRVKNNLSVLISMISLQLQQVQSDETRDALTQLQGRITSMAIVYQQLFGANQYTHLPFDEYIQGMLSYYQSGYNGGYLDRKESLAPCEIELERAVPLGLIINELISNAYTHGIPLHRPAVLRISLDRDEQHTIFFMIQDNGPGFKADVIEKTGMLLVRALCAQLHAELLIESPLDSEGGCRITLRLPYKTT
ncbi:MAG: hypothetical protein GX438_10295 [Treponema sp.]|nr:hypothetical protein [Treponema sp.]